MIYAPYHFVLDGHRPVPERDLEKWARWFETAERTVARTTLRRAGEEYCVVSTVFLGLDHNFSGRGRPILFETMVFADGESLNIQPRCATWNEAERQHARVCEELEKRFRDAPVAGDWRNPRD